MYTVTTSTIFRSKIVDVPKVNQYGSLKLWAHLSLDRKYWKYLINGIENSPTPPPVPPPYPTTEKSNPPYPPPPQCPSQDSLTSPSPRQRTIPSPIPSPQEELTHPISRILSYDTDCVGKTRRYSLGIILLTGRPTDREIKTQYKILEIIYHPDKT